jgi:hypothetical protein
MRPRFRVFLSAVTSECGEARQLVASDLRRKIALRDLNVAHLVERNRQIALPEDVPSRVFSVVPRWRLASLDPASAVDYLRAALAILRPLAAADRLDTQRLNWIPRIEAQLAALENGG